MDAEHEPEPEPKLNIAADDIKPRDAEQDRLQLANALREEAAQRLRQEEAEREQRELTGS